MNLIKNFIPVLFFLLPFLFVGGSALAQEKPPTENDPEAIKIMKLVKDKYDDVESMVVQYTQTMYNPESDFDREMTGTAYIKDDMFKMKTGGQEIISNGEKIWIFFEEEYEVTIDQLEEEEDMFKPSDIFELYEKDFIFWLSGSAKLNGQRYHIISFTPKESDFKANAQFHTIKLYVSMNDHSIGQAKIIDKQNTELTYTINDINLNASLTDSFFNFDPAKYPGIIVTDKTK